jgi:cytoskeletal protein RodZ
MRKLTPLLLAAAVVGLTACGGSTRHSSSTTTSEQVAQTTVTAASSTVTTSTSPSAKPKKPKADPPTHARTTTTDAKAKPRPVPKITPGKPERRNPPLRYTEQVTGLTPVECLRLAGLLNPHTGTQGEASGLNAAVGQPVFVDGPFKNRANAQNAAASLRGVEDVKPAGLYVVSATLSSHLNFIVNNVASCLRGAKGHGFLTF